MTLAFSGAASALGLGEIQGQAVLGQGLRLEISILGAEKNTVDAACLRLIKPVSGDDLPWLRKGTLAVRKGVNPVVEIRTQVPLRDPILQVALHVACGHEISREYVVMASPASTIEEAAVQPVLAEQRQAVVPQEAPVRRTQRVRSVAPATSVEAPMPKLTPRKAERRNREPAMADRLFLSDGGVGEPSLRLATELLFQADGVRDAQREILRLEFRLLMAMQEQAISQLAAAEKLRNMEGTLGDLQQHAASVAQRVEKAGDVPGSPSATSASVAGQVVPAAPSVMPEPPKAVASKGADKISDWGLYGALIGSVVGLVGWLFWRNRRARGEDDADVIPDVQVDPQRRDEHEEPGGVDLPFEPVEMGMPMRVDVDLESVAEPPAATGKSPVTPRPHDSLMSINATSLDEHFEANPVMELADIMLSFGRVKGAAQALQEYIDNNPQEALQPWIRLMDVYRLAGMRAEFEAVARNLNQHFNVEVQRWSDTASSLSFAAPEDDAPAAPVAPRPGGLEDMPRLMNAVLEQWAGGDVVTYLYQLLRDNRDGQRQGFPMAVVEDILFLIELKETVNRMEFS